MKLALLTFYDNYVPGTRVLAASLARSGHLCRFIHVKAMYIHIFSRDDSATVAAIRDQHPYVGVSCYEEGDVLTPTPVPITPWEEEILLEELGRDTPDVVGLTAYWSTAPTLIRIAEKIRRHFPSVRIVVGGPSAITGPEFFLPHADVVCVGEGEEAMDEWLEDPERTDVAGLWFRQGNQTIQNPRRPLIQDLDSLPMPSFGENEALIEEDGISRKLETNPRYLRDKWVFNSTRGCPMRCSYCIEERVRELFPGSVKVRRRSVDHFLAELRLATRKLPFEFIEIYDNVFVMDEPWLEEFAARYPREVGIPFRCNAFPGISTRRMLDLVLEAGAAEVAVDLQSGSPETLRRVYRRPTNVDTVRKTIRHAFDAGFKRVSCDLLVHNPHEDEPALRETFGFLAGIPEGLYLFVGHLIPYPGTGISQLAPPARRLPEYVHRFWTILCLLTQFDRIRRAGLVAISRDRRLQRRPELLDHFMLGYVKRLKYLGRPAPLRYPQPEPTAAEVGSFPALRLLLQERFPHGYIRAKLFKKWALSLFSRVFRPPSANCPE